MTEFREVREFQGSSVNTPLQHDLAGLMSDKKNYSGLEQFYQEKRDYFLKLLKGSRFKPLPCYGSYFQLLDYKKISHMKDTEYAIKLTKENGIASIPVSVFYNVPVDHKLLRFCFAKDN